MFQFQDLLTYFSTNMLTSSFETQNELNLKNPPKQLGTYMEYISCFYNTSMLIVYTVETMKLTLVICCFGRSDLFFLCSRSVDTRNASGDIQNSFLSFI